MVQLVVQKLDNFIAKTLHVKQQKKVINLTGKPIENEVYIQKQKELDSYLAQIKETRNKIN